jgi:phage shock protein A
MRSRSRPPEPGTLEQVHRIALWLTILLALALAGCGGEQTSTEAAIPDAVAQDLADQADAIAATYESGDECGAAQQADALNAAVISAINAGKIPAELQETLQGTANELVDTINCPEPTTTGEQQDCDQLEEQKKALEEEKKAAKGKGKERRLEEQIAALEQQIEDCKSAQNGEGDG